MEIFISEPRWNTKPFSTLYDGSLPFVVNRKRTTFRNGACPMRNLLASTALGLCLMAAPAISFAQSNQTGAAHEGGNASNFENGGFNNPAFWAALAAASEHGGGGAGNG